MRLDECGEAELADFCSLFCDAEVEDESRGEEEAVLLGSGLPSLRFFLAALAFLGRRAGVSSWCEALKSPTLRGYSYAAQPSGEKKTTVPLTLAALVELELLLCSGSASLGHRLLSGSLLMCAWGSLRFSDARHV